MAGRLVALDALPLPGDAVRPVGSATRITGISYDSRTVAEGDLFVCLVGGYADGHEFASQAIASGASALLVQRPLPVDVPQIMVNDTRAALPPIAAAFYGNPSDELTVIGVTGTDGKTSTTYILDHLLRSTGLRTGVIGTVSVRIADEIVDHDTRQTTPESSDVQRLLRRMADAGVSHAIVEATSHGLSLHRLDDVAFRVGAVTNVTTEHLEHHGTVEAYWAAKGTLFRRVAAQGGTVVINLDDAGSLAMREYGSGAHELTYSLRDCHATLLATDIQLRPTSTRFTLVVGGTRRIVDLPLLGDFNVSNALCAAAVAIGLDVDAETVIAALTDAPQIPGRMEMVDAWRPVRTVVDYAHTPASLDSMLRLLRRINPEGRLIAVFGSAGERDVPKRAMQGAVAARLATLAVFTNEDPREEDEMAILADIAGGAMSEGWNEGRDFWIIPDRRLAIRHAVSLAEPGDILLLTGKGHERSIIVGQRKVLWDEPAVAAEELARRFGEAR